MNNEIVIETSSYLVPNFGWVTWTTFAATADRRILHVDTTLVGPCTVPFASILNFDQAFLYHLYLSGNATLQGTAYGLLEDGLMPADLVRQGSAVLEVGATATISLVPNAVIHVPPNNGTGRRP